jgi:hypothetical protein
MYELMAFPDLHSGTCPEVHVLPASLLHVAKSRLFP